MKEIMMIRTREITGFFMNMIAAVMAGLCNGIVFEPDYLRNGMNENMNNLMSIDWAKKDMIEDMDYILCRHA